MTVITREIWDALPEERREELLDEHRDYEVQESCWADYVVDQFVEEMEQIGVHADRDRSTGPASGIRATARASRGMCGTGNSSWPLSGFRVWWR